MIYSSVAEIIGRTPLVELKNLEAELGLAARLVVKPEGMNPAGSAKDRVGLKIIQDAEEKGRLHPGGVIIEPTSGNTGIGLAAVCAARGYKAIIVMPDSMSAERIRLMKAYGAEVVLSPGSMGMAGAIALAGELQKKYPGSIIAGQFVNPANPRAHYETTGPEIWADTEGSVDIFVAAAGTGGTVTGTGRYLKEQKPELRVIAVEPAGSPVLSGGEPGPHKLQGIGAGFVPEVLDTTVYDEVCPVRDEDAYAMSRLLGRREGILAGMSGGAALFAAIQAAKKPENAGKLIVALLPDTGDHYLSTDLFEG